jgi:hypothetical protein
LPLLFANPAFAHPSTHRHKQKQMAGRFMIPR